MLEFLVICSLRLVVKVGFIFSLPKLTSLFRMSVAVTPCAVDQRASILVVTTLDGFIGLTVAEWLALNIRHHVTRHNKR